MAWRYLLFSLYLWHFPALIFITNWFGTSNLILLVSLAVTIVLSALSYYLVENPIRHSKLLRSWENPEINQPLSQWIKRGNYISIAILTCVAAMTIWQFMPSKYGVLSPQTMKVQRASANQTYHTPEEVQAAIFDASNGTWNTSYIPSPDNLTQEQMGEAMAPSTQCAVGYGDTKLELCEWGADAQKAKKTILVIGDSVAMAWTPAIIKASDLANTRIIAAGVGSCSIISIRQEADFSASGFADACNITRAAMFELAQKTNADTIVIASAAGGYNYQLNSEEQIITDEKQKYENWKKGTETTLKTLASYSDKLVLLGSPGLTEDPRSCILRGGATSDCTVNLTDYQKAKEYAEAKAVANITASGITVEHFDALKVSCLDGKCPVALGNYITHTDPTHITAAYAESLAPMIKEVLD